MSLVYVHLVPKSEIDDAKANFEIVTTTVEDRNGFAFNYDTINGVITGIEVLDANRVTVEDIYYDR